MGECSDRLASMLKTTKPVLFLLLDVDRELFYRWRVRSRNKANASCRNYLEVDPCSIVPQHACVTSAPVLKEK